MSISFTFLLRYLAALSLLIMLFPAPAASQASLRKEVTYRAERPGSYMKIWLVAGPFAAAEKNANPGDSIQAAVFQHDLISAVDLSRQRIPPILASGQQYQWKLISSPHDAVDLDSVYNRKDFAFAYAAAEIQAVTPGKAILAVGSDDAIKVWHNGKLVHENFSARELVKDDDLVPLELVKGSNQILLKIQDMERGWGFSARLLDKRTLTELLIGAVRNGNSDRVNMLINGGADINGLDESGMSPLTAARISGREELSQLLLDKGAKATSIPAAEKIIDHFYSRLNKDILPGVAVLVAKDRKVLYRKGFGYADTKNKIPVTPETQFRIGSVTKQFTAAAILKLQERKLLNVNDKLSKYIPDFPRGNEVSLYQLITHISGIHSYTGNADFFTRVTKPITPDSLVNAIKKDPYDFNPGERMLYNNSGYFILGYIIGMVSGKPFDVFLHDTFFKPLGMKNTGVYYSGIKLDHEAKGYSKKDQGYTESLNWDMSWAGGAGALYSTLDDLLTWNSALHEGKVLSEESMKAALIPAKLNGDREPAMQYGYGLMFQKARGLDVIGHGGGLHGFVTQLTYYPKERLSVVMFSNTDQPDVNFDPNRIAEAFIWEKMDKQVSFVQSGEKPKDLDRYTGRFELPAAAAVLAITSEKDRLFARVGAQSTFEIFPMSDTVFFWKVVEARLEFIKDESGAFNNVALHQGGQIIKGARLKEEKYLTLTDDVQQQYTGRYKSKEGLTVIISTANGRLYGQEEGQGKVELKPLTESEFVVLEINAKISFQKDNTGKVESLQLKMGGGEQVLQKED